MQKRGKKKGQWVVVVFEEETLDPVGVFINTRHAANVLFPGETDSQRHAKAANMLKYLTGKINTYYGYIFLECEISKEEIDSPRILKRMAKEAEIRKTQALVGRFSTAESAHNLSKDQVNRIAKILKE